MTRDTSARRLGHCVDRNRRGACSSRAATRAGRGRVLLMCAVLGLGAWFAAAGPAGAAESTWSAQPPVEPNLGDRILSRGSWGADVFKLQLALIRAGYDLVSDGHFGSATERAVIAFQLSQGLRPDGIVGPATVKALVNLRPTIPYIVQPGDSLWSIARTFGTTMEELINLNNLPDGPLRVGTELLVPTRPTYAVRPGDTLSGIAQRFGISVRELVEVNEIENPDRIFVGQILRLPLGSELLRTGF